MTDIERGRGSRRGIYLCAVATLGLALTGCGGNGSGASSARSAAQGSSPPQSAAPSQGSTSTQAPAPTPAPTPAPAPTQGPAPAPATPPAASTGNITLNWTAPTENTDGTPLTDLAGYDIHYGTAAGQYTQTIAINNPGIATYVVSNLAPGTYYFSVTAVNSLGIESPMSAAVSTTVN